MQSPSAGKPPPGKSPPEAQRVALAAFLRARRAHLTPAMLGLPPGTRRRTPGLTREEAAQQCGMSATWYTWIEQAREVSISPQALVRLARAFRLTKAERAYLFDLANKRDPEADSGVEDLAPPPVLMNALTAIGHPAYLLDRHLQALAWNEPAADLFIGWLDAEGAATQRNLLRYLFLSPHSKALVYDWQDRARRVVSEFRADHSHALDDPMLRALLADLRHGSTAFASLWDEQQVLGREGGLRHFNHPRWGRVSYEQLAFAWTAEPGIKLIMHVPATAAETTSGS
jgi:transcriptional regulator with XRE-family HTH domain